MYMYSSLHVCNITCTSPRAYTQREHETASNGTGGHGLININKEQNKQTLSPLITNRLSDALIGNDIKHVVPI